jgi:hypothetical protein
MSTDQQPTAFPPRGGHKNLCAYAAGISSNCTCDRPTLRCNRCGDTDGPFTPEDLCEPCARPMPLDGVA